MIQRTQSSNVFPEMSSVGLLELNARIERLNQDRSMLEGDVTDLEDSLKLNIQASQILLNGVDPKKRLDHDKLARLNQLIAQNGLLIDQIRSERQHKQAMVAEVLIHNQVTVEEQIFYTDRLASMQERLEDLRKLMHDKEYSYSNLVDNLNEFEELQECDFPTTLPNIDYAIHDNDNRRVMTKLSHQKQQLDSQLKEQAEERDFIKQQFRRVVQCITNGTDYHKIVSMVSSTDEMRSEGHENLTETANRNLMEEGSPLRLAVTPPLRSLHRELLILVKRQKKARGMMKIELKQSYEIGLEVKEQTQQLQQSNHNLQQQVETYRRQLKNLDLKLRYYGNRLKPAESDEIKLEQPPQEPSSSLIGDLELRSDLNKRPFHDAFLIKCSSEPDCSREWEANNHCSTADLD